MRTSNRESNSNSNAEKRIRYLFVRFHIKDRFDKTERKKSKSGWNSNGADSKGGKPADSFTFIQRLIKEVYRGNTFPFFG